MSAMDQRHHVMIIGGGFGGLSAARALRHVPVCITAVDGIDVVAHRVKLHDGQIDYDTLIVATGAEPNYFGNTQWEALAPGLKTVEDATEIRPFEKGGSVFAAVGYGALGGGGEAIQIGRCPGQRDRGQPGSEWAGRG